MIFDELDRIFSDRSIFEFPDGKVPNLDKDELDDLISDFRKKHNNNKIDVFDMGGYASLVALRNAYFGGKDEK